MRTTPLLADFIYHGACKPICEKSLTLPGEREGRRIINNRSAAGIPPCGALSLIWGKYAVREDGISVDQDQDQSQQLRISSASSHPQLRAASARAHPQLRASSAWAHPLPQRNEGTDTQ